MSRVHWQTNIKDVQKCSNIKQKWLCLIRQHTRRQLVEAMQRERCGEDPLEEDDDGDASRRGKTDEGDDFYACDLGVRYPTLQVASHREDLHMRVKVTLFFKLV